MSQHTGSYVCRRAAEADWLARRSGAVVFGRVHIERRNRTGPPMDLPARRTKIFFDFIRIHVISRSVQVVRSLPLYLPPKADSSVTNVSPPVLLHPATLLRLRPLPPRSRTAKVHSPAVLGLWRMPHATVSVLSVVFDQFSTRSRVRCDLKDLDFIVAGPTPSCSNCKERGIKCVYVFLLSLHPSVLTPHL